MNLLRHRVLQPMRSPAGRRVGCPSREISDSPCAQKKCGEGGIRTLEAPYETWSVSTALHSTTMRPPRRSPTPKVSLPMLAKSGERRSGPSPSHRDDVRDRGERDLFGRLRSQVETDRRMHARERSIGDTSRAQL